MAGTVVNTPPSSAAPVVGNGANSALSASYVNSFRISAVADRLAIHIRNSGKTDTVEFFNLCLSLARGIDYAVANGEIPSRARELPILLKQVCKWRNDFVLQAAIMVLMISVKNACGNGWFSYTDTEDLMALAIEIGNAFCSAKDITTDTTSLLPTVSAIMSRFYPQMRMGQILAFLKAKPGYQGYALDFHILKNVNCSAADKIRLFVAQTDNTETSSCIINPQQVNFLLNGKGVERRTNVLMDSGPQLPTTVTHLLKYGTNLIQAVGDFNGNYVIIVAFMSMVTPARPALQDYVQPAVAALDSDTEIIEGPSRISLNCPISFRRIKTPVKGHACKHLQCFDFHNYVDINSRRPAWRCPHCNQSVCYTDIRIDQKMVKILEEVGENIVDIIISADGSWKPVFECNDQSDNQHDKIPNGNPDKVQQQVSTSVSAPEILDLTELDDEMDMAGTCEHEDLKPLLENIQIQSNVNNSSVITQNTPSHMEDDFWSGIYLPGPSNGGVSDPTPTNHMLSPVSTDAISTALNREPEVFHEQSQFSAPGSTQIQLFGDSSITNEYGSFPSITKYAVNRTPVAVQALPAQTPALITQQRSRMADGQQQPRSHANAIQGPHLSSSSLQQQLGNRGPQSNLFTSSQPTQQITGLPAPSRLPSSYRVSPVLPTESQNLHQRSHPYARPQTPNVVRSSAHFPTPTETHQAVIQNRERFMRMQSQSPSAPVQAPRTSSFAVNGNGPRPDGVVDSSAAVQDWRPSGRMRGSLSGQAYSAALNQYIIQPTQPALPVRPLANLTTTTSDGIPSALSTLMENTRNAHGTTQAAASTAGVSGGS